MSSNTATDRVPSLDSSKQLLPREQGSGWGDPPVRGSEAPPLLTPLRERAETRSPSLFALQGVGPTPINVLLLSHLPKNQP